MLTKSVIQHAFAEEVRYAVRILLTKSVIPTKDVGVRTHSADKVRHTARILPTKAVMPTKSCILPADEVRHTGRIESTKSVLWRHRFGNPTAVRQLATAASYLRSRSVSRSAT